MKKIFLAKLSLKNLRWGRRRKVVYTYVVGDLLHVGHLRYLKLAKSFGDYLIVGVLTKKATLEKKTSIFWRLSTGHFSMRVPIKVSATAPAIAGGFFS